MTETLLRRMLASCEFDVSALAQGKDADSIPPPKLPNRVKALIGAYVSTAVLLGAGAFTTFLYGLMNMSDLLFAAAGVLWVCFMALLVIALAFVKQAKTLLDLEALFSPKLALTLQSFEREFKDESPAQPEVKTYLAGLQYPVATQLVELLHLQAHHTSAELDASEPARELERLLTEARVFRASLA